MKENSKAILFADDKSTLIKAMKKLWNNFLNTSSLY